MDNLKSILFVLPSTAIGGAETKLFNIMKYMSGIKCALLTHDSLADYYSVIGRQIYLFEEFGCYEPVPVSVRKTVKYARAIAETVRRETIDCIVGIMHTGTFYVSSARDIFRLNLPHIGTIEGNLTAFFRMEERTPTIVERCLLWYLLRRPSLIVVPSEGVKSDLEKNFAVAGGRIAVIYNGIDINSIRGMATEQVDGADDSNYKIIVTSCRLNAQKDFFTLLRAFKEIREKITSRLVIVGEGELREEIVRHAKELGIERDMVITGFQKNPFRFFRTADVFVLSSFFEGFGNVIVEAMALGIPVVATDCPSGPSEIIQHGVNGFLVPLKDHRKMAETVITLLTDEATRKQLALKGMERATSFGIETMVKNFSDLISRVT